MILLGYIGVALVVGVSAAILAVVAALLGPSPPGFGARVWALGAPRHQARERSGGAASQSISSKAAWSRVPRSEWIDATHATRPRTCARKSG